MSMSSSHQNASVCRVYIYRDPTDVFRFKVAFHEQVEVQRTTTTFTRRSFRTVSQRGFELWTYLGSHEEKNGVVQEIARLCSSENLSNLEVNNTVKEPRRWNSRVSNPDFLRKGQVGD
ncbi:hypothetical protein DITRI_Ditri16bG0058600 [Diplodiscus trichospermus]